MRALPCPPMMAELPSPALLGRAKRRILTFEASPHLRPQLPVALGDGMRYCWDAEQLCSHVISSKLQTSRPSFLGAWSSMARITRP